MQTQQLNITSDEKSTELGISPESHNTDVEASRTPAVNEVVIVWDTNSQPTPSNDPSPFVTAFLQAVQEAQIRVANGRGDPFRLIGNVTEVNTFFFSNDFRLIEEDPHVTTSEEATL
ncbi:hypothetical protein BC937DRAFT_89810 [Endogone sp. FLAS-F59071]|nr:hypothetical protein BC937DRAFT_89810 [Endogone sp. FLAS-F59071]|eukprot:RUS17561.1 hypothetical protein BC937DRAFT_89810 [Endogone sp. FLAS-F59071]